LSNSNEDFMAQVVFLRLLLWVRLVKVDRGRFLEGFTAIFDEFITKRFNSGNDLTCYYFSRILIMSVPVLDGNNLEVLLKGLLKLKKYPTLPDKFMFSVINLEVIQI